MKLERSIKVDSRKKTRTSYSWQETTTKIITMDFPPDIVRLSASVSSFLSAAASKKRVQTSLTRNKGAVQIKVVEAIAEYTTVHVSASV